MQKVSSMATSINTSKLPSIWGKLNFPFLNTHCIVNIVDYGCGRKCTAENVHVHLVCNMNNAIHYFPYDPYWGDMDKNRNALSCLKTWNTADLCVCANVINVIDDVEVIKEIIRDVTSARYWVFQVYEGNRSGNGKYNMERGTFQHHKRVKEYCWIFNEVLQEGYYIVGNFITNCLNLIK